MAIRPIASGFALQKNNQTVFTSRKNGNDFVDTASDEHSRRSLASRLAGPLAAAAIAMSPMAADAQYMTLERLDRGRDPHEDIRVELAQLPANEKVIDYKKLNSSEGDKGCYGASRIELISTDGNNSDIEKIKVSRQISKMTCYFIDAKRLISETQYYYDSSGKKHEETKFFIEGPMVERRKLMNGNKQEKRMLKGRQEISAKTCSYLLDLLEGKGKAKYNGALESLDSYEVEVEK